MSKDIAGAQYKIRRYDQHGCVNRMQTASIIDIRCPEKTPSKVWYGIVEFNVPLDTL